MIKYVLKRIIFGVLSVFLLSVLVFLLCNALPGGFFESAAIRGLSKERIAQLNALYGFDRPVMQRYLEWAKGALSGNFGLSLTFKKPVVDVVFSALPYSMIIGVFSLAIQLTVSIPLGLYAASQKVWKENGKIIPLFSLVVMSVPGFLIAVILRLAFVEGFRIFPPGGMISVGVTHTNIAGYVLDGLHHIFLPSVTVALAGMPPLVLYVQNTVSAELKKPYIQNAQLWGYSPARILFCHALKNAALPILTYVMTSLPFLLTGSMTAEVLFSISGAGQLPYLASLARDYNLLMYLTLFIAVFAVVCNLFSDFICFFLDKNISV